MKPSYQPGDRRPIATRELKISAVIAGRRAVRKVSPNAISLMSAVVGLPAGICAAGTGFTGGWAARAFWLGVVFLVQLRLLANMFDGMVANLSGTASPVGELYNEMPDRFSDTAVILGLGFAAGGDVFTGTLAALASVATAYVRVQCALAGGGQCYLGPMAKPQRMFAVTVLAVYLVFAPAGWQGAWCGYGAAAWLWVAVTAGAVITMIRRTRVAVKGIRGTL